MIAEYAFAHYYHAHRWKLCDLLVQLRGAIRNSGTRSQPENQQAGEIRRNARDLGAASADAMSELPNETAVQQSGRARLRGELMRVICGRPACNGGLGMRR